MPVASLLLKPNAVRRAVGEESDKALMQDAFNLLVRMILDQAGGGDEFASIVEQAALNTFQRINRNIGEHFEAIGGRLQEMIAPVITMVTEAQGSWPEEMSAQVEKVLELLGRGADKIKSIEIGMLRGPIREMVTIVEEELGFTPDFLEELLQGFFRDMADSYTRLAPTLEGEARANAQAMAQLLRRLNRKIEDSLTLPVLNPDYIATAAMKLLRKFDLNQALASMASTGEAVSNVLDLVDTILDLVPFTGQGTMSIGADQAQPAEPARSHCWYLSWLLGDRYAHRPAASRVLHGLTSIFNPSPADEIWLEDYPDPAAVDNYVRRYLFHREQLMFTAGFRDETVNNQPQTFFYFDQAMQAAALSARAGQQAAQATLDAAGRLVAGESGAEEAYAKAREHALKVLQTALDHFLEARDHYVKEADTKSGRSNNEANRSRNAAGFAIQPTQNAANAAQAAVGGGTAIAQVPAATASVEELRAQTQAACAQAQTAAQAVAEAYVKVQEAAAKMADAKTRAEAEPSSQASATQAAAQATLTAATEAAAKAELALTAAQTAFAAADRALTLARTAQTQGGNSKQALSAAQSALETARDGAQQDARALYETALNAYRQAADAVNQAADAAEDASSAALTARAAAFAAVQPPRYAFAHITRETMEQWAKGTSVGADFLEMVLHLFSSEKGNFLTNLIIALFSLTNAIIKLSVDRPIPQWIEWLTRFMGPFLGCFPHMHYNTDGASSNRTIFWFTYYGHRVIESHCNHLAAHGLRSLVLSILTLVNHDPDINDNRPLNHEAIEGVTLLFTAPFIFLWAALTPREHYIVQDEWELYWLDWAIGGLCFSLLANTVGFLVGMAIARSWNAGLDGFLLWLSQLWKTAIVSWIGYIPAMFLIHENDTDGGHWGHDMVLRPYITGYPERDSSPYRLPFRGGPTQCAQGNTGFWSHNGRWTNGWGDNTNQVYAYDFALDYDEDITASRDGIIVNFFDWAPDNENTGTASPGGGATLPNQTTWRNWNFVCLRHLQHDPTHDPIDSFLNPVQTYSIYGHGRNGSVRQVFGTNDPSLIIGRQVTQGTTLLDCDDTGVSAYNHLHTQVVLAPPQGFDYVSTAAGAAIGTGNGTNLSFTAAANLGTNFAGTLAGRIKPFRVYILFNGIVTARDNGAGSFQGANIDTANASIDYATGAVTVAWLPGFAPPDGVTISDCHDTVLPVGMGNNASLAFAANNLRIAPTAPRPARVPLPNTVVIQRAGVDVARDRGDGTFESVLDSSTGGCTVNYGTGAMNITWHEGHAPAGRVDVTARYETLEAIGTGDARTTPYTLMLPHGPVVANSVTIYLNDQVVVHDDGAGHWAPAIDTATSAIAYPSPCNLTAAWLADDAPANGVQITARFETTAQVGIGDGALLTFDVDLPAPVDADTLRITLGGAQIAADNGSGGLNGATIEAASAINYASGHLHLVFQAGQAPGAGIEVWAIYRGRLNMGLGNGALTSFNAVLPGTHITPSSVTLQLAGVDVAVDDGTGHFAAIIDTAAGVSGLDYATGAATLAWRSGHVLETGVVITARYESIYFIASGDNSTRSFDATLPGHNVTHGSIRVQLNTIEAARDDGAGVLSTFINANAANSNINYLTGALNIAFQAGHPPANHTAITVDYELGAHLGNGAAGVAAFNTTLWNAPVRPGSVRVLVNWVEQAHDDANQGFVDVPAGAGNIDTANSSIAYWIDPGGGFVGGQMTITWLAGHEPPAGQPVVVVFEPTRVLNEDDLSNFTIPFVYRNASHAEMYRAAQHDGVPRSLRYYTGD